MSEERHLQVSNGDIESLDAALAWAVNCFDTDFKAATMVQIRVEQIMRSAAVERISDDPSGWEYVWTAVVSGCIEG